MDLQIHHRSIAARPLDDVQCLTTCLHHITRISSSPIELSGINRVPQAVRSDDADWYDPGSNRHIDIVVQEQPAGRQTLQLAQELSSIGPWFEDRPVAVEIIRRTRALVCTHNAGSYSCYWSFLPMPGKRS